MPSILARLVPILLAVSALGACNDGDTASTRIPPENVTRAVAQLDTMAAEVMRRSGIPGMAVAVVHQGRTVYAKGFGVRRLGDPTPVDANTVFQLASLSKSVAATVVATQVGKGLIGWDTPVVSRLPWFALQDATATAQATVGDFFAHRSGLPEHAGDELEELGFNRRQVLERLRHLPTEPLRSRYAYTNFGLTAAAEAVAQASGRTWEDLSQREIYQPLGMTSTSSRYADFMAHSNRAAPHIRVNGAFVPNPKQRQPDAQSPAGGVSSNVRDMALWMDLILHTGELNGRPFIPPQALLPALSPQYMTSAPANADAATGYYGYGFNLTVPPKGPSRLSHSGAFFMGAATNFNLLPAADTGIVILTNAFPVGAAEALGMMYMDMVLYGEVTRDWVSGYGSAFERETAPIGSLAGLPFPAAPTPPLALNAYTGTYANGYFGDAQVADSGGSLVLSMGPAGAQEQIPLKHWDG
ncbi:MAG TPA: serine hydrolase, partial [Castellaniella sp.]|nr:serine hydrolase [Castellaniella sp.]